MNNTEKNILENKNMNIRDTWDNIQRSNIHEIRVLWEVGENGVEKSIECMCSDLNFPKFKERHKFKDSRSSANPKRIEIKFW